MRRQDIDQGAGIYVMNDDLTMSFGGSSLPSVAYSKNNSYICSEHYNRINGSLTSVTMNTGDTIWTMRKQLSRLLPTKVGKAGQIIYHFRKDEHRNISLPQDGYVSGNNTPPVFYNFSTNAWSLIEAPYSYNGSIKYTALFLSWLGNMMQQTYTLSGTFSNKQKIIHAIDSCKLDFNETTGYNFYTISSDLSNERPIYIVSGAENMGDTTHAFIIDSKKIYEDSVFVSYLWDNDYEVSWEEYNRLDSWRFEMPDEYDPCENNDVYCEHNVTFSRNISFAMNWGGNSIYNNLYYNAYHYVGEFIDEAGYYPPTVTVYAPYWAAINHNFNDVRYFFHNFREQ